MVEIDEDVLEWEDWKPDEESFLSHMVSGSIAGVTEHTIMYPMDTLKTHVQCDRCNKVVTQPGVKLIKENCTHAFKSLVRTEGVSRLWRGVSTMFVGCIPAHAAYFSIYEETKRRFRVGAPNAHPLGAALSGVFATLAHDMVMTPCDTIKQRLQLGFYRGPLDCLRTMIRTEGFRSIYVSLPTTLSMNLPFGAVMVSSNEALKDLLVGSVLTDKDGKHTIASYLVAGSGAGAIAALATTPLDMIKTRLQTQQLSSMRLGSTANVAGGINVAGVGLGGTTSLNFGVNSGNTNAGGSCRKDKFGGQTRRVMTISHPCGQDVFQTVRGAVSNQANNLANNSNNLSTNGGGPGARQLTGAIDAAKVIYLEQGLPGFMRGCVPRLLVSAPSVAVSWTAYECAKSMFKDIL